MATLMLLYILLLMMYCSSIYAEPNISSDNNTISSQPQQPIGEDPNVNAIDDVSLSNQRISNEAGKKSIILDFTYHRVEELVLVTDNIGFVLVERKQEDFIMSARFEYTFRNDIQVFLSAPLQFNKAIERTPGLTNNRSSTAVGDLDIGMSTNIIEESLSLPNTLLTLDISRPTETGTTNTGLGAGVSFSRQYDPITIFTGLDYRYTINENPDFIRPEHRVVINFGYAFRINEIFSISTTFSAVMDTQTKFKGQTINADENFWLNLATTTAVNKKFYLRPFLSMHLNSIGSDFTFGIKFPYTW